MKLRLGFAALVLLSYFLSAAAAAEKMEEVFRSRYGNLRLGGPGAVEALDPLDGSLWEVEGATVARVAPSGELAARSPALHAPSALGVDVRDGSCWVWESLSSSLTHVSEAGRVLSTTAGDPLTTGLVVSSFGGSVWTTGRAGHFSAAGEKLWQPGWTVGSVVVAAADLAWVVQLGVGSGPQAVLVTSDGTELNRLPAVETVWGIGSSGTSLWVTSGPTALLRRISVISGDELASYVPAAQVEALAVSPADGSVWVYDHTPGAAASGLVVHLSADGTELLRSTDSDLVSYNPQDGSVWIHLAAGDLVQLSATGTELRRNSASSLATSPRVYDPTANTWWTVQGGQLQRIGADGTVLFEDPLQALGQLPGAHGWASPLLHAVWAWDAPQGGSPAFVQLSPQADFLLRRPSPLPPLALAIYPSSGAWWLLCDDGAGGGVLLHLAADGTELQRFPGVGTGPLTADVSDGSAWVVDNSAGTDTAPACHVHHFGADGTTLAAVDLPYACRAAEPQPRGGTAWFTATNGTTAQDQVIQLASDGQIAAQRSVGESGLGARAVASVGDGTLYLARTGVFSGAIVREVSRIDIAGTVLWSDSTFTNPTQFAVSQKDNSLWVVDSGETTPSDPSHAPGYGSAIVHLSADGTELWRGDTFCQPTAIDLVPSENGAWVADTGNGQLVHLRALGATFIDVPVDFWAFDAIRACVDAGIVKGYSDNTYRPDQPVTRDQMAVYISRALAGGDAHVPTGPATATFTDVPPDYWAFQYVEYAVANAVVTGYSDGTYRPAQEVTRAQMAVFVSRSVVTPTGDAGLESYTPPTTPSFADVPTGYWAYRYIEYAREHGIVQGYADGYRSEVVVTRDQMAVYLARAFGLE